MSAAPSQPSVRVGAEMRQRVTEFLVDYCWLIDNDRLEEWTELFDVDGRYEILPLDNVRRGLPLALMSCRNKAMVQDRVLALRVANEYNIHNDRHVVSPPRFTAVDEQAVECEAAFIVAQTDQGGNTRLFAAGTYRLHLACDADRLRILRNSVVLDTFCVQTLIATPL